MVIARTTLDSESEGPSETESFGSLAILDTVLSNYKT
jgi:hypothetical protein